MHTLETLAKTIYGEARGEIEPGKFAVAHVIVNRAAVGGWWGNKIDDVCRKAYQFSCWNEDDPNRITLERLTSDDREFMRCASIAATVLAGDHKDNSGGATHYHTAAVAPNWSLGQTPCAVIGNHIFYKLKS